jgi:hypothetical protein
MLSITDVLCYSLYKVCFSLDQRYVLLDLVLFKMCLFLTSSKLSKLKWQLHVYLTPYISTQNETVAQ